MPTDRTCLMVSGSFSGSAQLTHFNLSGEKNHSCMLLEAVRDVTRMPTHEKVLAVSQGPRNGFVNTGNVYLPRVLQQVAPWKGFVTIELTSTLYKEEGVWCIYAQQHIYERLLRRRPPLHF